MDYIEHLWIRRPADSGDSADKATEAPDSAPRKYIQLTVFEDDEPAENHNPGDSSRNRLPNKTAKD